jgi:transcriptional regulator with XRE-family HTH domain
MEVGEKIRKIRVKKDISQENLSKMLGVSQNTIHKIESGKKKS